MIIFAPILLRREQLDWESGWAFNVLRRFMEELSRFSARQAAKVIVTDSRAVAEVASVLRGLDVHLLDEGEAVNSLQCIVPWAADRVVVKVDFHSGLLDSEALSLSLSRFEEDSTRLLVAVAPADDNPVQLSTFGSIVNSGFLHLMDSPEKVRKLARDTSLPVTMASLPYPFSWRAFSCSSSVQVAVPGENGKPVELTESDRDHFSGRAWLRLSDDMARMLWVREEHVMEVLGMTSDEGSSPALSLREDGKGGYLLLGGDGTVRLMPICNDSLLVDEAVEVDVVDGVAAMPFVPDQTTAFIYTLQRPMNTGEYTYMRSFTPDADVWRPNRLILADGRRIHGRQAFPKILVSRGLMVGSLAQIADAEEIIARGEARSLVLRDAYSVSVRSQLDVLRLKVVQRQQREACHV